MDRNLLRQIWPIFSAEAREHLQAIGSGILELERDPSRPGVVEGVRRTAHSLKGSAASLGLADVEALAHAVEGTLAGFDPKAGLAATAVEAVLDAVQAVEEALAAADGGGEARIPALGALVLALREGKPRARGRRSRSPAAAAKGPEGLRTALEKVEADLARLCAPMDAGRRAAVARGTTASARALAASLPAGLAPAGERILSALGEIAAGSADPARLCAAVAGDLVEIRQAAFPEPGGPDPAASPAAPAGAAPAADKSIRVLASTLDSLSRQLELLAMSEARHQRRARELGAVETGTREAIRALEAAAQALRAAGLGAARQELAEPVRSLRALAGEMKRLSREGQRDAEQQRLVAAVLREDLRALRMVPAALVLEPLRRAVRDLAGRLGKELDLVLSGGDVRIDRRIVDELRDPLLHLVRNAVDHGIEAPEARRAAGKDPRGRLRVSVEPRGNRVGIVVEDDGAGIDVAAVRASAVQRGALSEEEAARLGDGEAARLVFRAGLSTSRTVSEVSGRGVGLDVVQETVARLQGTVDLAFTRGQGTRFDLELPLTVAATAAILFRAGREVAALPADAVERVLLLSESSVGTVAGRPMVRVEEAQVPFVTLSQMLGVAGGEVKRKGQPVLVLQQAAQRVAVAVDDVVGQQDVVVSSLGSRLARVPHLAGASVLDDGRVVGVLAPAELFRRAQPSAARSVTARPRIVVADDSLTTRSAVKALLEIAGFTVLPAGDGEEAFALVREAGCQLVVSDVQMPVLDGFALTRRIKADPKLREIPVVLVTSLDAAGDRAAGLEAGADGYLVKREVEHGKLLELVRQLLPATA
jgi:two-component system chemotaxis sensor kinase CheA